jgi:hypothetical protein
MERANLDPLTCSLQDVVLDAGHDHAGHDQDGVEESRLQVDTHARWAGATSTRIRLYGGTGAVIA